jgi:hypothetical protein
MHFKQSPILILIVLLVFGLTTGCSEKKETAPPAPDSPLGLQPQVSDSPLAVPEPTRSAEDYTATTPVPPAPASGNGVVTGVLTLDVRGLPLQPVVNTRLFLARMLTDENGPVALASLDENTAPLSVTNADGQFAFVGVEPGMYALIIKTPIQAMLAHDVVSDMDVVVTVNADQATELGDVHVEMPY